MKSNNGYIVPDNADPQDYNCLLVFYPADDLYRRELFGALDYFGTWLAWERDANHKGTIAARAWKTANEKTREAMGCLDQLGNILTTINETLLIIAGNMGDGSGSVDLSGVITAVDGVTAEISAIGDILASPTSEDDMSTIVNVNCGCGCGESGTGTGAGNGVDYTIPPPDVPPTVNPPVIDPPLNPSNAQKCSMANYLVYVLRLTLLKVQETGGDYLTFSAWAETLFSSPVDFVYALTYQTWAWCKQWFTGNDASVDSVFDEFVNTYVCALFSAVDAQEAHDSMIVNLFQTLAAYPDISYTARMIAEELPYQLLFMESGAIDIPAGFASRSCCGSVQESQPPAPELPDSITYKYWLLPMALDASAGTNDPNTTYITTEAIIGNGINAGALLTRTSQQSNASMLITATGFSRDYLNTRFGAVAGDWELAGYVFQTGGRSQVPAMPLCTHSIQGSTNVLLAGVTALEPNEKYLFSVPETVGDEFTNSLTSQGYTIQRKADRNFSGGAGSTQPVITIRMTTKDGDYTGIRTTYRLYSAYMVIREKL